MLWSSHGVAKLPNTAMPGLVFKVPFKCKLMVIKCSKCLLTFVCLSNVEGLEIYTDTSFITNTSVITCIAYCRSDFISWALVLALNAGEKMCLFLHLLQLLPTKHNE